MPRVPRRRRFTGNLRRGPLRDHPSHSRSMHLNHANVGFMHRLQETQYESGVRAMAALNFMPVVFALTALIHHEAINLNAGLVIVTALRFCQLHYNVDRRLFMRCRLLDYLYHDISEEEELEHRETVPRLGRQNIRFRSWNDQECYDFTGFRKHHLIRIYLNFGLRRQTNSAGFIRVPNVADNRRGQHHLFHPEEIFLFMMMKYRTGFTNKQLCDLIFGGWPSRWSHGWPWILNYLDEKYAPILGHQGLLKFVDQFPRFFEAIQSFVRRTTMHRRPDGSVRVFPGLRFLPFVIFGFIDCSVFRINRPYSGPRGFTASGLASRDPRYYDAQRAVYTRHKMVHGIKIETVMLPNGISTVFGPVSARPHDVSGVLWRMSRLDSFLETLQQGNSILWSLFGDGVYNCSYLRCVRSYFRGYGDSELTEQQILVNHKMKSCRETIEWTYGALQNQFRLVPLPESYRLGQAHPYAQAQLRVSFLLYNCFVCLNGNAGNGYRVFDCPAPSLEEYLS